MAKINYHLHSTGSDGKLTPEQVIQEAIKAGITHICFTDHYKFPPDFHASDGYFTDAYVEEFKKAREKYKDKIDISFGAEFAWLNNKEEWFKQEIEKRKLDYAIGSIHFIIVSGKPYFIDHSQECWIEGATQFGGVRKYVEEYYNQLRLMVKSGIFNGIAHFDLIKIYNKDFSIFSEDEDWYKNAVIETLDVIKDSKMCMEINPRGLLKTVGVQYPSFWILQEAKKRDIPITIGTDCHNKPGESIDLNLDKAYELARKAGFTKALVFKNRVPREVEL